MSIAKNFPGIQPDAFSVPSGWEQAVTPELVREIFTRSVAATQSRGITPLSPGQADMLAANALVAGYAYARLIQQLTKSPS